MYDSETDNFKSNGGVDIFIIHFQALYLSLSLSLYIYIYDKNSKHLALEGALAGYCERKQNFEVSCLQAIQLRWFWISWVGQCIKGNVWPKAVSSGKATKRRCWITEALGPMAERLHQVEKGIWHRKGRKTYDSNIIYKTRNVGRRTHVTAEIIPGFRQDLNTFWTRWCASLT